MVISWHNRKWNQQLWGRPRVRTNTDQYQVANPSSSTLSYELIQEIWKKCCCWQRRLVTT